MKALYFLLIVMEILFYTDLTEKLLKSIEILKLWTEFKDQMYFLNYIL